MLTYDSAVELNRTSHLCYEVFITPNTTVNLFSSSNLVINAHYMLLSGQYYISDIGIVVGGASGLCTNVKIHGEKCMAFINGENISTHNNTGPHAHVRSVGSSHMPTVWRVTSSKGYSIADVRCTRRSDGFLDVEALDLLIPTSLQDQNAHGLLGTYVISLFHCYTFIHVNGISTQISAWSYYYLFICQLSMTHLSPFPRYRITILPKIS